MNLKLMTIASGSKGNCVCIRNNNCTILIDMGISLAHLKRAFNHYRMDIHDIDAILITHEHNDHISGLTSLIKNYDIPIYAHSSTMQEIMTRLNIYDFKAYDIIESGFGIKDMDIQPFRTRHDSIYSVGYSIMDHSGKISYATDLGSITSGVYSNLMGSDIVFIESNHDTKMLNNGKYPMFLKKRISSSAGHLSNDDCAEVVLNLYSKGTSRFILGHLSENNNTKRLAYSTTANRLIDEGVLVGQEVLIDIAADKSVYIEYSIKDSREIKQII